MSSAPAPSRVSEALAGPPTIHNAPLPDWITTPSISPDGSPHPGEPVTLVIEDIQANASEQAIFRRTVASFGTPQGANTGSRLEVIFQPLFESLTIHHITVLRDGKEIDRTNEISFHSSFFETDAERRIKDGRVSSSALIEDLRVGDSIDFAYSIIEHTPPLREKHQTTFNYFGGGKPVAYSRIRVSGFPGSDVHHRTSADVPAPEMIIEDDVLILSWEFSNIPAVEPTQNRPSWYPASPWIQTSTFDSWAHVAQAIHENWESTAPANDDTPALDARVAQIREDSVGDSSEAARLAVSFVQDSIHDHPSGAPLGILPPTPPEQTLSRRMGDSLDQSALLAEILRRLGSDAKIILLNRDLRQRLSDILPSSTVFDHAIVEIHLGGSILWIDPTLAEQGGTLRQQSLPEYRSGLPITPDTKNITTLRSGSAGEDRLEIVEHFFLAHRSLDPTLTSRILATGGEADRLRSNVHSEGAARAASHRASHYSALYPGALRKGEPQQHAEEPYGISSFALTDVFNINHFGNPDASGETVLFPTKAHFISTALPPSTELGRTAPLAIAHPKKIHQTIEIEANGITDLPLEPIEIEAPGFKFTLDTETRLTGAEIRYTYESLSDHIKPADLNAHNEALEQIKSTLSVIIPIPLARGFAFKQKAPGSVSPRGASKISTRAGLANRKTGLPAGLAPLTQLRDVDTEGEIGLGSIEDDEILSPTPKSTKPRPSRDTRNIDSDRLASEQGSKMERWKNAESRGGPIKLILIVALGTIIAGGFVSQASKSKTRKDAVDTSSVASYKTISKDTRFVAASQAAAKSDLPSALKLLDDLAKDFPRNPDLATLRATFALRQDDTEKAIKLAREAVVTFPNHSGGNAILGKALFAASKGKEAIPHLEKSISLDGSEVEPKRDLAKIYVKEGNTERAEILYRRVLKAEPDDIDSTLALTKIYELRGNRILAKDALEDAHRRFPKSSMIAIALAKTLQRDGDTQNAIRTAERSLDPTKEDAETLLLLSTLHEAAGNTEESELFRIRAQNAENPKPSK